MNSFRSLIEIGPGFWNIRGQFKIFIGIIDIGTHMSIARLSNGNFLVIDAIPLTDQIKTEIDQLTENGKKIEAVLAVHPFHTLAFPAFYSAYPNVPYYGTPRHLIKVNQIPWVGDLNNCSVRTEWEPDIQMSIPEGAEFVDPKPERSNHFSSVFVFHKESKTIHVDDTILYAENPGFLLRLVGMKTGSMHFHPSFRGPALYPRPEAPVLFRNWLIRLMDDWDFDNICTAHMGNRIGGAKKQLQETLEREEKTLQNLIERNKDNKPCEDTPDMTISNNECG